VVEVVKLLEVEKVAMVVVLNVDSNLEIWKTRQLELFAVWMIAVTMIASELPR
jgi:hypothetical protein